MLRSAFLIFLLLTTIASFAQMYSLQYVDTKTDASFRGLSITSDNSVWVSGSMGWLGRSTDNGNHWKFRQVPGYEQCDFRTIYAFDSNNAIIANAGSPAYILRTSDGGVTWVRVYENTDSAAFIDGVDFWTGFSLDKRMHGLMYGDPINGRMLLLYTRDAGRTWKERWKKHAPKLVEGEASFAASGTAIRCLSGGRTLIATGGTVSRIFYSKNKGRRWRSIPTPMLHGTAGAGIFSILPGYFIGNWMIAGGDYRNDTLRVTNFFYTNNYGRDWLPSVNTTRGYRECLAQIEDIRPLKGRSPTRTAFAVGPSGIDISADDGVNWKPLSDEKGFHVIKPSIDQNRMFLTGGNGKLAIMKTTQ